MKLESPRCYTLGLMKISSACPTYSSILQGPGPLILGRWEPGSTPSLVTWYSSPPTFTRLGECPVDSVSLASYSEYLDRFLRAPSHISPREHGTISPFSTPIPSSAHCASQLKRVLETDSTKVTRQATQDPYSWGTVDPYLAQERVEAEH